MASSSSGCQAGGRERLGGRAHDAVDLDLAESDEGQREVGERREVAGRPDAPLLRHDRMDAVRQQRQDGVDDRRPTTAVAQGQGVRPQEQHRADDLARERRADAGRVAHQQVLLELTGLGWVDVRRGEVAEPGRHAVDDGAFRDKRLDDVAGFLHPLACVDVERDRRRRGGRRPRHRRR